MRQFGVVLVASCVVASPAFAADKPVIGPAPAWVKPVEVPPVPAESDGAAMRILLSDQQVKLERDRETVYSDIVLQIETPQGLAAGNISFPWDPDTDTLTVHKLLIRRGGEVIDVLGSGQTFTVMRREQNLASATLDGVLTANIQPEGLQVGDVIEFAASIASSDPVMKGHVEQMLGAWNGVPIDRAHLSVEWPAALPVRFRATESLPGMKAVKTGDTMTLELSLDDVKPLVLPNLAPARYRIGRLVEFTDFASWADLAALMAPLYQTAAALPADGKLQAELERIRGLSADPKARAEAALALVQDKVRYVALAMGSGGLVPADAETTWARRYGDCKGKTALLLALLHGLGIEAQPVAVSTGFGDGLDQRLPMVALFNHVLVRAVIDGRTYWLDGTRTGDTSLDRLQIPGFGWGLPLVPQNAALVRMMPAPLTEPMQNVSIRIDATAGLTVPAPTTVEAIYRGDNAVAMHSVLAQLAGEAKDRALKDYWRGEYDFIDVTSADAAFDRATGELRLTMKGNAKMDWSDGWYETDGTGVGYRADFHRDPGPNQDAPYAVSFPYYTRNKETILLPPGFSSADAGSGADLDRTVAGIEYHRQASLDGNVFTIVKTERSVVPEFPAKDAAAAQKVLRQLADETVYLRRPAAYRPTRKESEAAMQAALDSAPESAAEFVARGGALLGTEKYEEAIAAFDRALAIDPETKNEIAQRGIPQT
jgi:transglutaminase-like putative cysteine protease